MPRRPVRFGSEEQVHDNVCDYLRLRYPYVLWWSEFAAGIKLPKPVAIRMARRRSRRGIPDLHIAKRSHVLYGDYSALYIELKGEGVELYKKDGTLRKDEHIAEQAEVLEQLRQEGAKAEFCVGFDQAKKLIDEYLTGGSPLF